MSPIGSVGRSVRGGGTPVEVETPESAIAHFDATDLVLSEGDAVDTWPDNIGTADLSATGAPVYRQSAINGGPAVDYDGVDDHHQTTAFDINQPNAIIAVVRLDDVSGGRVWSSGDQNERQLGDIGLSGDEWRIWAGDNFVEDEPMESGEVHILGGVYDGDDSEVRRDGLIRATGDPGPNDLPGITIAADPDSTEHGNYSVGELWVLDSPTDSDVDGLESDLSDKWGIELE